MIVFDFIVIFCGQIRARNLNNDDLVLALDSSIIRGVGSYRKRSVSIDLASRVDAMSGTVELDVAKLWK